MTIDSETEDRLRHEFSTMVATVRAEPHELAERVELRTREVRRRARTRLAVGGAIAAVTLVAIPTWILSHATYDSSDTANPAGGGHFSAQAARRCQRVVDVDYPNPAYTTVLVSRQASGRRIDEWISAWQVGAILPHGRGFHGFAAAKSYVVCGLTLSDAVLLGHLPGDPPGVPEYPSAAMVILAPDGSQTTEYQGTLHEIRSLIVRL